MANSNNKIDFDKVNEYAKVLGIPAKGKKKDEFINEVLDAIVAQYTENEEGMAAKDFKAYKEENKGMLQFYMANKDYGQKPEKEVVEEPETAEGVDVEEPEDMAEEEPEEPETAGEPVVEEKVEKKVDKTQKKDKEKEKKAVKKSVVKKTRAEIFGEIMADGKAKTKKGIIEEMVNRYKGSSAEADFQVTTFLRLLVALGFAEKNAEDAYRLLG
uniref:Uncharacterized protein n=1 Tax=viral metagenome TaxID=1070528 RepID=A0A6M3M5P2_9ZZZZ